MHPPAKFIDQPSHNMFYVHNIHRHGQLAHEPWQICGSKLAGLTGINYFVPSLKHTEQSYEMKYNSDDWRSINGTLLSVSKQSGDVINMPSAANPITDQQLPPFPHLRLENVWVNLYMCAYESKWACVTLCRSRQLIGLELSIDRSGLRGEIKAFLFSRIMICW